MKIEVGKTYRHSEPNSDSTVIITKQWSKDIFEGSCPKGGSGSWLFNSNGDAIGYPNNTGGVLRWGLQELVPSYEYKVMLGSGYLSATWENLTLVLRTPPNTNFWLVRERNKHETMKLFNIDELNEFITKLKNNS